MGNKSDKSKEKKRQQKIMKKRQKDNRRHKAHGSTVVSENAVQHQMISNFGNVQNFVKAVQHLGQLFKTDPDLSKFRFDAEKVYEKIDLAQMHDELADMYADEDLTIYDEQYEAAWKDARKAVLDDLINDELVEGLKKTFDKMSQTKKGFKKDYRSIMAGKLLIESHLYTITEAPAHENTLWELLYNAALKENPKDLPEPAPKQPEAAQGEATSEPEAKPEPEAEVASAPEVFSEPESEPETEPEKPKE